MKKNQLLKFLTIEETAQHLSGIFVDPISQANVFQFGLEGQLKLSVNFVNGAVARRGKVVTYDQAKMRILPVDMSKVTIEDLMTTYSDEVTYADELPEELKKGLLDKTLCYAVTGIVIGDNEILEFEKEITHLSSNEGVYDLPMIGGERLDIEHQYQMLSGGVEVKLETFEGTFVVSQDGQWYQLQERSPDIPNSNLLPEADEKKKERAKKPLYHPDNYYPAGGLPDDSRLLVRTSELAEFESRISEPEITIEKPLPESERNSLVRLVIGMAVGGYGYNIEAKRNDAVARIQTDLELFGLPLRDDAIRKYLSEGKDLYKKERRILG